MAGAHRTGYQPKGSAMSNYFLASTSTGKIHLVSRGSYNATPCNSRNRGFRVSRIEASWAVKADAAMYCGKCFPNGKPSDERLAELCAR